MYHISSHLNCKIKYHKIGSVFLPCMTIFTIFNTVFILQQICNLNSVELLMYLCHFPELQCVDSYSEMPQYTFNEVS